MKRIACALALLLHVGVGAAAAGVIDTTTAWNQSGVEAFGNYGEDTYGSFGQTFTADSSLGLRLDSFSLFLDFNGGSSTTVFAAYIAAWDGSKVTGPILYENGTYALPQTPQPNYTEYTFDTGGVSLIDGQQYVAFFSVSGHFTGGNTLALMGVTDDVYAGGNFVRLKSFKDFGLVSTMDWQQGSGRDAATVLTFSDPAPITTVPEPTSLCLLGTGVVMLGRRIRRGKA